MIKILGLAGSLRKGSYTKRANQAKAKRGLSTVYLKMQAAIAVGVGVTA